MKKTISLLLCIVMIMSAFATVSFAAPEDHCISMGENGAYVILQGFNFQASNTKVSFDLSLKPGSENGGVPRMSINGNCEITPTAVKVGSSSGSFSWGELTSTHWRHVEIVYSGSGSTLSIDGKVCATGEATSPTGFLYFLGYPGYHLVDNVVIETNGREACNMTFDDDAYCNRYIGSDTSGSRLSVPAGSYCDYTTEVIPDNVEYIFDTAANCEKLTVSAGSTYLQGDINEDGDITIKDSKLMKQILLGSADFADYPLADIDGDGDVTIMAGPRYPED